LRVKAKSTVEIWDEERKKTLYMKVYYPVSTNQQKFPMVIFSHGWLASKNDYELLGRTFASSGYVCVHPTHEDSILLQLQTPKEIRNIWKYLRTFEIVALVDEYRKRLWNHIVEPESWTNRAKDLELIINSTSILSGEIGVQIDEKNIGVIGHSMGAYVASLMAGTVIYVKDKPTKVPGSSARNTGKAGKHRKPVQVYRAVQGKSFRHPSVKCAALISPQGSGVLGLRQDSWKNVACPMMVLAAGQDTIWGRGTKWNHEAFDAEYPGNDKPPKMLVFVPEADHGFGGIFSALYAKAIGYQVNDNHVEYVRISVLAFCDAYLKQNSAATEFLSGESMTKYAGGKIVFSKK
jgi:predicted dienelactone hydrolase